MPTNQPQHIPFTNLRRSSLTLLTSTTSHSSFQHHQLLLFLTITIYISLSPSPASLHPVLYISTSADNTHQPSSFSVLRKHLLPFRSGYLSFTSQPAPQGVSQVSHRTASYACALLDAGMHFPFHGRQVPSPKFRAAWIPQ